MYWVLSFLQTNSLCWREWPTVPSTSTPWWWCCQGEQILKQTSAALLLSHTVLIPPTLSNMAFFTSFSFAGRLALWVRATPLLDTSRCCVKPGALRWDNCLALAESIHLKAHDQLGSVVAKYQLRFFEKKLWHITVGEVKLFHLCDFLCIVPFRPMIGFWERSRTCAPVSPNMSSGTWRPSPQPWWTTEVWSLLTHWVSNHDLPSIN